MNGDLNIVDYRGLMVIEVMVEKFDFFLISEHSTRLRDMLEDHHYPSLIFDLTRVKVIDSSVFGFLLETRNSLKKRGHEIAILCRDPEVMHVMNMLKVPQIMRIFESREKAADFLDSLPDV
jgi:anti-anti-sigma factor